jgi:uncharacterized membrane protein YidH (DUF202 family)
MGGSVARAGANGEVIAMTQTTGTSPAAAAHRDLSTSLSQERTGLAHERTDVAILRTRMAAERTLMAWIRTALSMISFGFTILKFLDFLHSSANASARYPIESGRNLGLVLILLGTVVLMPASYQHWQALKQAHEVDGKRAWSLSLTVGLVLQIIGLAAFLNGGFHVLESVL